MYLSHCANFVLKQVKTDRIDSNQLERILSLNLLIINIKRETRPRIKELYVFLLIKLLISGSQVQSLHGSPGLSRGCGVSCNPFFIGVSKSILKARISEQRLLI